MSPDKGRRGTSGKGGSGSAPRPEAVRRLGLLIFGVVFIALFAVVGISVGVGDPSVPSGDAAVVDGLPGDIGKVPVTKIEHAIELAAAQGGEKKTPKPGDPKYDEMKETAVNSVLEAIWIQGQAERAGVEVSDKEVAAKVKSVKKESFKSEAEFQKFLKESHYTLADVRDRVMIQMLSEQLQEELKENAGTPSQSEVENYYEAAKDTQFTQKPSRDVRTVTNKDRKKAEEAADALGKDNSAKNWARVAKKYSEDPTTKKSGGLQKGLQEGTLEEPLNAEVFSTPEGELEGPTKGKGGYVIFEVVNSTPESVQELKTVENQIQSTLVQRNEQEYFANFISNFQIEWGQRSFCAPDYTTERCANFKADGRPPTAPEGCYEADPKGGRPEACPAPVSQLVPALPGTVTPLEPKGNPLAQRPIPRQEAGEEAAGATGLPEGAVPAPEGAPPAEEAPPAEAGE